MDSDDRSSGWACRIPPGMDPHRFSVVREVAECQAFICALCETASLISVRVARPGRLGCRYVEKAGQETRPLYRSRRRLYYLSKVIVPVFTGAPSLLIT
jgi:hypothetical protein